MDSTLAYTGIIASVWIILGIHIASRFYPNYSHSKQFCSELGAFGSPTQKLSPLINNYPLGALFAVFGCYLIIEYQSHLPTVAIGVMVVIHAICTWVCGWFPMDADAYTNSPSQSCKIHSWSGLILLVSFIIAPKIVIFSSSYPLLLRFISAVCLLCCFYFSYKLTQAFKLKTVPGLYQRLSYGSQILWLFVYSLFLIG